MQLASKTFQCAQKKKKKTIDVPNESKTLYTCICILIRRK